jgi:hypothetical protein
MNSNKSSFLKQEAEVLFSILARAPELGARPAFDHPAATEDTCPSRMPGIPDNEHSLEGQPAFTAGAEAVPEDPEYFYRSRHSSWELSPDPSSKIFYITPGAMVKANFPPTVAEKPQVRMELEKNKSVTPF